VRKYRKKPVVVEAVKFDTGCDMPEVDLVMADPIDSEEICPVCGKTAKEHGNVKTLEGYLCACPGDFIIRGIKGEHYPCKPDIFKSTYEPA
jgi:hypothetical protein